MLVAASFHGIAIRPSLRPWIAGGRSPRESPRRRSRQRQRAYGPFMASRSRITPSSERQILKVVPKGLRSFDANDADFFLELLAGPRDRHGMPESIRFWKSQIEAPRARQDIFRGPDLWSLGLRQVVAGQGGFVAAARPVGSKVYVEASAARRKSGCCGIFAGGCPD